MSTRCQTRIYYGEEKVCQFYRHCDGYPDGHGLDLCKAVEKSGGDALETMNLLKFYDIKLEPVDVVHGDREFFYEVFLPDPWDYYPDGKPEPRIVVHDEWENKVVFDGTPKDVKWQIMGLK